MDLPGDLDEPDRRVQVPADRVLLEGLDLGHRHAGRAEMRQGVLDQPSAQPLPPCASAATARLWIQPIRVSASHCIVT